MPRQRLQLAQDRHRLRRQRHDVRRAARLVGLRALHYFAGNGQHEAARPVFLLHLSSDLTIGKTCLSATLPTARGRMQRVSHRLTAAACRAGKSPLHAAPEMYAGVTIAFNTTAMSLAHLHRALPALLLMWLALPAGAADRVRPGQWVGTTIVSGRTFPTSSCISQGDADAMNGDAKSVQGYLEKTIPPEICKISGVKVDGNKIIYSAACGAQPAKVITTLYHGASSEGTDSTGSKTDGKLIGACK